MTHAVARFAFAAVVLFGMSARGAETPMPPASSGDATVTFNKHIAPLLFQHCAACHRPDEVAPFSLLTYEDARRRAKQLHVVTSQRFMPPWKSVAGHGSFVGERRLTDDEIALLERWAEQGAPEGDPKDLPPAPKFPEDWQLGQPDIVLTMPEAYEIPADGPDIYRNFVLKLELPPGKYLKAAEFRPANRRVVHHAVLAIDPTGNCRKQDEAEPEPGFKGGLNLPGQVLPGSMGVWTPGRDPLPLPDGLSMPWAAGADLVLQLHFHPSGKPESDRSSIGLFLTEEPPRKSMVDLIMIDRKIDIPPGERTYRTQDELTLPIDVDLLGVFPHMHLIGRDFKLTAHPPSGDAFPLLWINDWDFNWQSFYQYATPMKLPAGTRIVLEATHDNSADNVRNPSQPPERVVWGEQTTNEMTVAILQMVPQQGTELPKLIGAQRQRLLSIIQAQP